MNSYVNNTHRNYNVRRCTPHSYIEFVSFLAAAGSARRTDFSWAYNRRSYSAHVTAVLPNVEYSGRSVNGENFATKMRLNGHARRSGEGTETARRKRERTEARKEVVKDEGREISVGARPACTQAAMCWKAKRLQPPPRTDRAASHRGMQE